MNESPIAIVTGAGSGIGRAAAVLLAEEGYAVVLVGRTESKLRETAEQIAEVSDAPPTFVFPADVSEESECMHLVDATLERFGRLDALVNVAGYAELTSLAATSTEQWRRTLAINTDAVFYLTRAAWGALTQAESAIVVNVSSVASLDPFPGLGLYGAAKAAVNLLTLTTAREGRKDGLRAVAIAPGAVETPLLRSLFDETTLPPSAALTPEQVGSLMVDCIAGRRSFQPGEVLTITPDNVNS